MRDKRSMCWESEHALGTRWAYPWQFRGSIDDSGLVSSPERGWQMDSRRGWRRTERAKERHPKEEKTRCPAVNIIPTLSCFHKKLFLSKKQVMPRSLSDYQSCQITVLFTWECWSQSGLRTTWLISDRRGHTLQDFSPAGSVWSPNYVLSHKQVTQQILDRYTQAARIVCSAESWR